MGLTTCRGWASVGGIHLLTTDQKVPRPDCSPLCRASCRLVQCPPPGARVPLPPCRFAVLGLGGSWYCRGLVGIWPGHLGLACCCSVAQSSDSLRPHGLQHARLPCPSLPLAQTHVHLVSDATQPSHPLSPLLLLSSIFPSIRVFQ